MATGNILTLKINKIAFTKKVKDRIEKNMRELGRDLAADLGVAVSIPYPPASTVGSPPHRRSGDLKNSFKFITKQSFTGVALRVYTDIVYALRLEFGFVGTDRLGRNINQGPRPYWRPVFSKARIGFRLSR